MSPQIFVGSGKLQAWKVFRSFAQLVIGLTPFAKTLLSNCCVISRGKPGLFWLQPRGSGGRFIVKSSVTSCRSSADKMASVSHFPSACAGRNLKKLFDDRRRKLTAVRFLTRTAIDMENIHVIDPNSCKRLRQAKTQIEPAGVTGGKSFS